MANGGGTSWTVQVYVVTRGVKIGKWLTSWVREYMATPHRPEKPPDRPSNQPSPTERDGDQAPDTPPTEPEPIPVEEPPNAPGKRGPYVVHQIYRPERSRASAIRMRSGSSDTAA